MNNLQLQQPVQLQMLADVNVLMNQKDFKLIPSGWEMSNVVLQFFVQSKGNLKLWLYFWLPTVMPKINFKDLKPNLPSHKVTKQLQDLDMLELLCQLQMEVGLLATMVLSMTMFQCHALILTGNKYGFKIEDI